MSTYLSIELRRAWRNKMYLLFTVGFPVVIYLVFSHVGVTEGTIAGTTGDAYSMVSMAAFGAVSAALFIGTRISNERRVGWVRQLRLTGLSGLAYLGVKVVVAMLTAVPAIVLVFLAGALTNGVSLSAIRWIVMVLLLVVGVLPFAALGVALGYLVNGDSAQPVITAVYMTLSLLGGLWFPAGLMPSGMRAVAQVLPTYRYAELGWRTLAGRAPGVQGIGFLAYWGLLFALAALVLYRRAGRRVTA
jgi:ABC-2 type transport system permease protein